MESSRSRNFPIRQDKNVGNIPFAFGKLASDNSDMENDEIRRRIRARLVTLKRGPIEAAEKVEGLERNYINDFLTGKKDSFSTAKQALVAAALDWPVEELTGAPPRVSMRPTPKIAMVPLLDSVTAGRLASPASQIPIDRVPLLAFADLGSGNFFALRVEGDSMDRYSPEGSIIIVNKDDKDLLNGKCYVFAIDGRTTFKMWQNGDTPHLAPYSTNPLNKPIFFKRKRDLEVIGRVKRTLLDL